MALQRKKPSISPPCICRTEAGKYSLAKFTRDAGQRPLSVASEVRTSSGAGSSWQTKAAQKNEPASSRDARKCTIRSNCAHFLVSISPSNRSPLHPSPRPVCLRTPSQVNTFPPIQRVRW